jgi:hypothetical protein
MAIVNAVMSLPVFLFLVSSFFWHILGCLHWPRGRGPSHHEEQNIEGLLKSDNVLHANFPNLIRSYAKKDRKEIDGLFVTAGQSA